MLTLVPSCITGKHTISTSEGRVAETTLSLPGQRLFSSHTQHTCNCATFPLPATYIPPPKKTTNHPVIYLHANSRDPVPRDGRFAKNFNSHSLLLLSMHFTASAAKRSTNSVTAFELVAATNNAHRLCLPTIVRIEKYTKDNGLQNTKEGHKFGRVIEKYTRPNRRRYWRKIIRPRLRKRGLFDREY